MITQHLKWIGAGAVTGAAWFLLPFLFDVGVEDMQDIQPIPVGHTLACIASVGCASATGIIIALVFRRWLFPPGHWFFLLPIVTLPVAVFIFSLLLWLVRQSFGIHSHLAGVKELLEILLIYVIYGLVGIFAPVLYGCALLTQYIFRIIFARGV